MSATEELRRMLDERGVEWGNVRNDGSESDYLTEWQFDGIQSYAVATEWAVGGGLSLETHRHHLTPEQAIAATLGRGTCYVVESEFDELDEYPHTWLSCGHHTMLLPSEMQYCPKCGAKLEVER